MGEGECKGKGKGGKRDINVTGMECVAQRTRGASCAGVSPSRGGFFFDPHYDT